MAKMLQLPTWRRRCPRWAACPLHAARRGAEAALCCSGQTGKGGGKRHAAASHWAGVSLGGGRGLVSEPPGPAMPPNSPQGLQNKSSRCGPRPPNAQLPHCAPTPACTRSVGPAGFWVPKCFVKGSCLTRPPSSVPRPLQNEGTKVQDAPRGKTSLGAHASLCSPAPPPLTRSQHPQSLLRATGSKNERSGKMRRGTPSPSSGFHAGRGGARAASCLPGEPGRSGRALSASEPS